MFIVPNRYLDGKVCSKCDKWKPRSDYGKVESHADKMRYCCKECYNEVRKKYRNEHGRDIVREQKKRAYDREPPEERKKKRAEGYVSRKRDIRLRCLYGINESDYNAMLASQGGGCAICGAEVGDSRQNSLFVDHCHAHGHVRGLLCHGCNTGIGFFGDSVERLLEAALYLEKDRRKHPQ